MIVTIFSCDRAMQLDATLRSFLLHCCESEQILVNVIYKASTVIHEQQYARLAAEYGAHDSICFVRQRHFRRDVLDILMPSLADGKTKYLFRLVAKLSRWFASTIAHSFYALDQKSCVLLLVDDNIFVRGFDLHKAGDALIAHPDALGVSLRLGINTTYCYPVDRRQALPTFTSLTDGMLKFNWTNAQWDFGYPLEVSSSLYRLGELFPFLSGLSFNNPNSLEGRMAARARLFKKSKPFLLCYENSVTFCDPINKVQTVTANRAGSVVEYSSDHLAQLFESGYRIKVEAYTGFVPNACHQEVALNFEKREAAR